MSFGTVPYVLLTTNYIRNLSCYSDHMSFLKVCQKMVVEGLGIGGSESGKEQRECRYRIGVISLTIASNMRSILGREFQLCRVRRVAWLRSRKKVSFMRRLTCVS